MTKLHLITLRLLVFVCLLVEIRGWEKEPVVTIKDGQLRGTTMTTLDGNQFHAFRGIPYAEPPLGNRRFMAPGEPAPWEGVRDASEEASWCAQVPLGGVDTFIGSEDCLYLNVYTKQIGKTDAELLPVLFWIHGGGFYAGDGGITENGPEFLMDQSLVIVTINYRLGPFGFLSTGNQVIPGNAGLKDQVMALKWVQDNIETFGGDKSKVTIHGYSSGAVLVHAHLFSPMSKGLFHAAIMQGGSLHNDCLFQARPSGIMQVLGGLVGCTQPHSSEMRQCLREKTAEEIALAINKFPSWGIKIPIVWSPVIEWAGRDEIWEEEPFLFEEPATLIADDRIPNDVPVISGVVKDEGLGLGYVVSQSPDLLQRLDQNFGPVSKLAFCLKTTDKKYAKIKEFYFSNHTLDAENDREKLIQLSGDAMFIWGQVRESESLAAALSQPVYFYLFTFQGRISEMLLFNITTEPLGVGHADDLAYIFRRRVPFPDGKPNAEEYKTIKRMGKILANFAATGNPTPEEDEMFPERWLPLPKDVKTSSSRFRYLEISTELGMRQGRPFPDRMDFWDRLMKRKKVSEKKVSVTERHDEL